MQFSVEPAEISQVAENREVYCWIFSVINRIFSQMTEKIKQIQS